MLPGEHLGLAFPRLCVSLRGDETLLFGRKGLDQLNLALAAFLVAALSVSALSAFAAPPSEDENPKGNCGPIKDPPPGLVCVKGEGKPHLAPSGQR